MDEPKVVTASFAEDPKFGLAIDKCGGGSALIKTKGPGTVCSYTCSQSRASFYTGEEVLVSWKLNKGTSSLEWTQRSGHLHRHRQLCRRQLHGDDELRQIAGREARIGA